MNAASDDLTKPLGRARELAKPGRIGPLLTRVAVGALALGLGGIATILAVSDDPSGGEPQAAASIRIAAAPPSPETPPQEAPVGNARIVQAPAEAPRSTGAEIETSSGVTVLRPDGAIAPGAVLVRVPEVAPVKLAPAPDRRLIERTRFGSLPRIGADGARPADVYARPVAAPPGATRPVARVAVLVGGMGISPTVTAEAVAKLPPAVTLAFAPYGSDLEGQVARARESGHEVLLQTPMEPFDYPDNDPGPHTLTTRAAPQERLDRLHWVMGRFTGYAGLVNFMGAKLTADEAALAPILKEIAGRGLAFVDDGSSSRSVAVAVAAANGAQAARADLVLDGSPRAEAIDRELQRLEEIARERGLAIGSASALPLTVERIARWSRGLESRGVLLVPVSSAWSGHGANGRLGEARP